MSTPQRDSAPVWEVRLPDRRSVPIGYAKPRATVVIRTSEGDGERIQIPLAVGRILASKQNADEIHPETRSELSDIIDDLERSCARTRIERLINRRDYAKRELVHKLEMDGYHPDTIACCLDRACAIGLVSDRRYADIFIRSKVAAGWGMVRIERELAQKGIDVAELPGWPYEYLDPDDELSRAVSIAQTRHVLGDKAYQKLVRFLCARGFSLGVATRAASKVLGTREEA